MTHDARMGWIGLSAFVAEEHAGRAPVVTKPAVRFTAEEQQARRNRDRAWLWVNGGRDAPPKPRCAMVHVDVDVSSIGFKVGDRVRLKGTTLLGTVAALDKDGDPVIRFDGRLDAEVCFALAVERIDGEKPAEPTWVKHVDGRSMVPPIDGDTSIEVRYRNGLTERGVAGLWCAGWRDDGQPFDIVAYRVVS